MPPRERVAALLIAVAVGLILAAVVLAAGFLVGPGLVAVAGFTLFGVGAVLAYEPVRDDVGEPQGR